MKIFNRATAFVLLLFSAFAYGQGYNQISPTDTVQINQNGNTVTVPVQVVAPQYLAGPPVTVVLAGDSITQYNNGTVNATTVASTVGSTSVQITYAGHSLGVGQRCTLSGANQIEFNGVWNVASVIDANNFTVTLASPATVATPTGTLQIARGNTYGNNGYFTYMSGLKLKLLNNAGLAHDTAAGGVTAGVPGLYSRLQKDVFSYNPQMVILMIGVNDLQAGQTAQQTFASIKLIADAIVKNNIRLVLCTLNPVNSTYSSIAPSIPVLNALIRSYTETKQGVVLADTYSALVDPTSTAGYVLTSPSSSSNTLDGLHPSAVGAQLMASVISNSIAFFHVPKISLNSSYNDAFVNNAASTNTLINPLMQGTGGTTSGTGASGTVPTNWVVSAAGGGSQTAVASIVARTAATDGDILGNNINVVFTSAAANDNVVIRSAAPMTGQFTNGEWLYADCAISWSSATNMSYLEASISLVVGGVTYTSYWGSVVSTTFPASYSPYPIRVPPLYVPSGTISSGNFYINTLFSGVGGATITLGRCQLRQAATLSAIN